MTVYTCAALFAALVILAAGNPTGRAGSEAGSSSVFSSTDNNDYEGSGVEQLPWSSLELINNDIEIEGSGIDQLTAGFALQKSAFTAKLVTGGITGLDSSSTNQRIVFNSVLTSVGNDYNPKDGRFTTSITGTYVFSLTLMSKYRPGSSAYGCLRKNDMEQICVWSNGNKANEMSSNTITLNLEKGDVVDVILKTGTHTNYELQNYKEDGYCSFSGFLLYPEESTVGKLLNSIKILLTKYRPNPNNVPP